MPFDDELACSLAVVAYDPRWPKEFGELAVRIAAVLGPVAEHIDHIGSTAVPGLVSKDCIDIQIRVARLDEELIVPPFAELGFRLRPEPCNQVETTAGRQWPKLAFAPPAGERAVNVHVRAFLQHPGGDTAHQRNRLEVSPAHVPPAPLTAPTDRSPRSARSIVAEGA